MSDEVKLLTYTAETISPVYDGILQELFTSGGGVITGGVVTIKDANTLHISDGYGALCGREFKIFASDIPVTLSSSGTLNGRLYLHMDLSQLTNPLQLLVETGASLTPVQQDSNVNTTNGVYEINLATFSVGTSTISNLVSVAPTLKTLREKTLQSVNDCGLSTDANDIAGAAALSELNSALSDVKEVIEANEIGNYVNISSYTSTPYVCPCDGYAHIRANTAGTTMQVMIQGPTSAQTLYLKAIGVSGGEFDSIFVRKGMKLTAIKTGTGDAYAYFVPLE